MTPATNSTRTIHRSTSLRSSTPLHPSPVSSRPRHGSSTTPSLRATGVSCLEEQGKASSPTTGHPSPSQLESSSWISGIVYRRLPDGSRYLALFLKTEPRDEPVALLYGPAIPAWLPGLLSAGIFKSGRRSVGAAYNRLLKSKTAAMGLQYQRVEGWEAVNELKRILSV